MKFLGKKKKNTKKHTNQYDSALGIREKKVIKGWSDLFTELGLKG